MSQSLQRTIIEDGRSGIPTNPHSKWPRNSPDHQESTIHCPLLCHAQYPTPSSPSHYQSPASPAHSPGSSNFPPARTRHHGWLQRHSVHSGASFSSPLPTPHEGIPITTASRSRPPPARTPRCYHRVRCVGANWAVHSTTSAAQSCTGSTPGIQRLGTVESAAVRRGSPDACGTRARSVEERATELSVETLNENAPRRAVQGMLIGSVSQETGDLWAELLSWIAFLGGGVVERPFSPSWWTLPCAGVRDPNRCWCPTRRSIQSW